jgi:hypothetical protein
MVWQQHKKLFTLLTPGQQLEVYDYFQATKDFPDEQLLVNRRFMTQAQPSLPQRAGKHFSRLWQAYRTAEKLAEGHPELLDQAIAHVVSKHSAQQEGAVTKKGTVTIRALAKPEIDLDKLARALLTMVDDLPQAERDRLEAQGKADPNIQRMIKEFRNRRAA